MPNQACFRHIEAIIPTVEKGSGRVIVRDLFGLRCLLVGRGGWCPSARFMYDNCGIWF